MSYSRSLLFDLRTSHGIIIKESGKDDQAIWKLWVCEIWLGFPSAIDRTERRSGSELSLTLSLALSRILI